ncbi:MAG: efflux RND transporter periplasmic adaptor subunit [Desulfobacteraceae bacterium]|jgi:RND family efflux transporter MFP subunit|nr:efflux RND transporter periplasmic adaptor subunit [Desulfobacteraceae bacterium]
MKKIWIPLAVFLVVGLLGTQVSRKLSGVPPADGAIGHKPPVAVQTTPVTQASIARVGHYTGSLLAASEFILAPKIAGRIEKIAVRIGDPVTANELVAVLDDGEYRQQVARAAAERDVARATVQERRTTLENSLREFERTRVLRQKQIASQSELDAAEADYRCEQARFDVAKAQVAQMEAALKAAEVQLAYTRIRVPEHFGDRRLVVGERFLDPGAMVAANTPIVSILDLRTLTARIHVIERDYPAIRPGLEATLTTDAFAHRQFAGRVSRVAPLLKETSRQARVEIEVPNDEGLLKPGMFVRAAITLARRDNATVVPLEALVERTGQSGVFVADLAAGIARFVPVTVGIVDDRRAEILRPALAGHVVTLGHHLLDDGAAIRLPDAG